MENSVKKAPVKFWEDLLHFQHYVQILSLPQIYDGLNGSLFISILLHNSEF